MNIMDLRTRIIRDDDNRHSFQIYNMFTQNLIFSAPHFFSSRAEAEDKAAKTMVEMQKQLSTLGLPTSLDERGHVKIELPGLPEGDKVAILCAMAQHRKTGKYGYVVMTDLGQIIQAPTEYFDTPDEAYNASMRDREKIAQVVKEAGFGEMELLPPNKAEFKVPEEQEAAPKLVGV